MLCQSEFVYETAPFKQCHATTIAETPEGLVCSWFGGTHEKHPDVAIYVARREGAVWTAPQLVDNGDSDGENFPCWNPVLFQMPDGGPLLLFYKVGPDCARWWGMLTTSTDGGRTWSEPRRLPDGIWGAIKNKPVMLADGTLLCPASGESTGWQVTMQRTRDLGETWEDVGPLNDGKNVAAVQPTILEWPDGVLQILARTKQGHIYDAWSRDQGMTWTPLAPTILPNNNSGLDAVTLRDGRGLLVYNHTGMIEGKWGGDRTPLNVAVTQDGRSWAAALVLETQPGEYSYPAVIQTADGLVHTVYTWKRERPRHVTIDPAALEPVAMPDGEWPDGMPELEAAE